MNIKNIEEEVIRANLPLNFVNMVRTLTIKAYKYAEIIETIPDVVKPMMIEIFKEANLHEFKLAQTGLQFLREFPEIGEWVETNQVPENATEAEKDSFEKALDMFAADLYEQIKEKYYAENPGKKEEHEQWRIDNPIPGPKTKPPLTEKEIILQMHDEPPGVN